MREESWSSSRRPGALGEPERQSQERQEQQPGYHLSPRMPKELLCPESDTAGRCLSGSGLTIMDFAPQAPSSGIEGLLLNFRESYNVWLPKKSLGEGAE